MSIISQLHMDMAHRCARKTLALAREGRDEEALEVATLAAESYDKAIACSDDVDHKIFMTLAMLVPHPSEQAGAQRA